jgi:hypothetical protein
VIENLEVGETFGTSDHQIIRWDFIACKENHSSRSLKTTKTYDYFKADYEKIKNEAKLIDWSKIVEGEDCELDFDRVKLTLLDIRDKWVPTKKQTTSKCKWVNRAVTKSRRAKIKAWVKYQGDKSQINLDRYQGKLKKSRETNKLAKRNYEMKLAENVKKDSKSFYAYIRSKQRSKDKVGPLKNTIGKVVTDDKEAANMLNEYFSSVFTIEDCSNIPEPVKVFEGKIETEGLLELKITREMVENKLENLNVNKCPGLDEMHPKILFELRKELAEPLSKLYTCSLNCGIVPKEWKEAGVTPLFKKGKKSEPQNYRPVSLTSLLCKIMESLLKDAILLHLNCFSLIRDSQHGFTKGRSCLTNLLEFLDEVTRNLDEGRPVDIIYLDFAKAFDKVPYQRLFKKLRAHGIGGSISRWFKIGYQEEDKK